MKGIVLKVRWPVKGQLRIRSVSVPRRPGTAPLFGHCRLRKGRSVADFSGSTAAGPRIER